MNVKPGIKTSEAWAGAGIGGLIMWGDGLVEIPEIVAQEPGLMAVIVVAKYGDHDGGSHVRFGSVAGQFACPEDCAATKRREPLCTEPTPSGQFERTGVDLKIDGQHSNIHAPDILRVQITARITAASTTRTADGTGIAGHDPQSLARQQR